MIEITTSGRLSKDPWRQSWPIEGGREVPAVCAWLECEVRNCAGAWIYLVALRPKASAVLASLRKDDRVTVGGEALAVKVFQDDSKPFVELIVYSLVPWRQMTETSDQQEFALH